MSNDSIQASSIESPPSTSATSISVPSEATSGCSHLAEYLELGIETKQDFIKGLHNARSRAQKIKTPQESAIQYHCIECTESGSAKQIVPHHLQSQHSFSFCPQSSTVYCVQCKDTIYVKTARNPFVNGASPPSNTGQKRKSSQVNGDDSYITANSAQRPCGRDNVRGLFNLGHTCYMNAVIQTMVHNSLLSSFFLGKGHPPHTCSNNEEEEEDTPCVSCGFTEIFSESRVSDNTQPMAALSLLKASWLAIPEMQGERQQDSHEWYLHIIDKLHECEKPSFDHKGVCRCFIHKAFFGRTRQEIACNKCSFVSRTQEPMLYLTLDFQKQLIATSSSNKKKSEPSTGAEPGAPPPTPTIPTMIACLEDLTATESLSGDTYTCRGCSKAGKMTKSIRIRKLPAILCMQVNRFQNELRAGSVVQKKIKGRMQYPLEIDMRPYTTKARKKGGKAREGKATVTADGDGDGDGDDDDDAAGKGGSFLYELESVIVHEGKAIEQGHYFAFCRGEPGGPGHPPHDKGQGRIRREWYMFNDAKVTVAAETMVLEQEAYLLFYSLKKVCGAGKGG